MAQLELARTTISGQVCLVDVRQDGGRYSVRVLAYDEAQVRLEHIAAVYGAKSEARAYQAALSQARAEFRRREAARYAA